MLKFGLIRVANEQSILKELVKYYETLEQRRREVNERINAMQPNLSEKQESNHNCATGTGKA